jgi:ankyrin repeat protein
MKKTSLLILCTLLTNNTFAHNIFEDVRTKNKEALKQRLQNCENCAIKDEHGNNALHIAAQQGDQEIIDILATAPTYENWSDWLYAWLYAPTLPNIDEQNDDGDSPLLCATYNGDLTTAEQLVQKGARMDIVNKKGLSPAFLAVLKDDPRFIRVFVAHKLNLAQHKRNGDTVFHTAVKEKKPNSIYYCAQETSLHNITNKDHKTPTFIAIDAEDDVLKIFTKEQLNTPATSTGIKPIHYATQSNKYNALNYLLNNNISVNEPDAQGNTPIFYANNETTLNFLLQRNADIHKRNNKGEDILAVVTHNNNIPLMTALMQKHNVDIDTRDNKGQTSLMRATIEQNYEMMTTLINNKANIRITDNSRENILHKIARNDDQKAARIALDHEKALLTDLNKNGDSPLFVAIQNGNITFAEFLIDAGSRIDTVNNNGDTIIHELIKQNNSWLLTKVLRKIDYNIINHKNKNSEFPLSLAAQSDNIETIKALILCKANTYTIDADGNNIAHIAAKHSSLKTLQYLQSRQDLLRSHNHYGETPFICGAKHGQLETTKLLLTEEHFINSDVINLINAMKDRYFPWDEHYHVYNFLVQHHNSRVSECQKIVTIAQSTQNVIKESNSISKIISEKTFQRPYHPESLGSWYSENDLYKMTEIDRNKVKKIYTERQNRAISTKNKLEQTLHTITLEEQKRIAEQRQRVEDQKEKARIDALKEELIKAQAAAQNTQEEPEHSPIEPTIAQEAQEQASCCICFEDNQQLLQKIPCKNAHSDHICGACLKAASIKTCPICRGPITK